MTETNQSKATPIKTLIKKHKGILKEKLLLADFKEPIAILLKRTRKAEWLENATQGELTITHSDGKNRTIFLDGNTHRFQYGDKEFTGYIIHEDFPTPLPERPLVTTELTGIALEKTLNDIAKWKAKEITATTNMYKTIGYLILGAIALLILYKLVIQPQQAQPIAQTALQSVPIIGG